MTCHGSSPGSGMVINYVVEGASDFGVAETLITAAGHEIGQSVEKRAKSKLDPDIPKYLQAATYGPGLGWLILRDSDNECPVELRRLLEGVRLAGSTAPDNFLLRIVHTMSEGWFLADTRNASAFFRIPENKLPQLPEEVADPKRLLLNLSLSHSPPAFRKRFVRTDGSPGPEFTSIMNEFARNSWDIHRAADKSPSLDRAIHRLSQLD